VECGICVERCPFDVDIIAKLAEAVAMFEVPAAA
jgi:predicted aldo/keto reductase-like oxidoreductase